MKKRFFSISNTSDAGSGLASAPAKSGKHSNRKLFRMPYLLKVFAVQVISGAVILGLVFGMGAIFPNSVLTDYLRRAFNYNPEMLGVQDNEIGKIKFVDKILDYFAVEGTGVDDLIYPVGSFSAEYFGGTAYLTTEENVIVAPVSGTVTAVGKQGSFITVTITAGKVTTVVGMDFAGVTAGRAVSRGDYLGINAGGGSVLFSVYYDGVPINLENYSFV